MKKKAYCKQCDKLTPSKRLFNSKKTIESWLVLLFDYSCKKCGAHTHKHLEATCSLPRSKEQLAIDIPKLLKSMIE